MLLYVLPLLRSNSKTLLVGFILLWIVGFVLVNKWIKSTEKRYKLPYEACLVQHFLIL